MRGRLRLERVTPAHAAGLREMVHEFAAAGEVVLEPLLESPATFFANVARFERGDDLPPDRVRQSYFLLLDGERPLGSSRLRHFLIPQLERDGGHIGYEIRPSERRRGYGSELLRLTLAEARAIGLSRALLTTEPDNAGSIGVITRNGGRADGTSVSPRTGRIMNRYWIEL